MSYYDEIYNKRLNRYGTTIQGRIKGQREREFAEYVKQSIYRVTFNYDDTDYVGILEPNKFDKTQTIAYLLTANTMNLTNGSIVKIGSGVDTKRWMIWYLESSEASGYHRYVALHLNYFIMWTYDKTQYNSWVYITGPAQSAMTDQNQTSTGAIRYLENNNTYKMILPYNTDLHKEDYFEVDFDDNDVAFRVVETDVISTSGIMYVTLDPTLIRNSANIDQTVNDAGHSWYVGS